MSTWEEEEKLLKAYNERVESSTHHHWSVKPAKPAEFFSDIDFNFINKDLLKKIGHVWNNPVISKQEPPKCDCGGAIARTTHSDWCSYENWSNRKT